MNYGFNFSCRSSPIKYFTTELSLRGRLKRLLIRKPSTSMYLSLKNIFLLSEILFSLKTLKIFLISLKCFFPCISIFSLSLKTLISLLVQKIQNWVKKRKILAVDDFIYNVETFFAQFLHYLLCAVSQL